MADGDASSARRCEFALSRSRLLFVHIREKAAAWFVVVYFGCSRHMLHKRFADLCIICLERHSDTVFLYARPVYLPCSFSGGCFRYESSIACMHILSVCSCARFAHLIHKYLYM
jgi:hypothetical protein